MKYIYIVNFNKYQHYSERPTIWIKWYKKCLQDFNFLQLNNGERWLFVGLIMLASNNDGYVMNSCPYIRDSVMYKCPNSVALVRNGLRKMVKLGLIKEKNAIIEKSREEKIREDKSFKKPFYGNDPIIEKWGKRYVKQKNGEDLLWAGKDNEITWK